MAGKVLMKPFKTLGIWEQNIISLFFQTKAVAYELTDKGELPGEYCNDVGYKGERGKGKWETRRSRRR